MPAYRAFALMTRPARGTELWRLGIGVLLAAVVMFGLGQSIMALASTVLSRDAYWRFAGQVSAGDTPLGALVLLFSMGALGVGAVVAAQVVHKRGAVGLFGPWPLFWRQFYVVGVAVALLYIVIAVLPPWPLVGQLQPGLPAGRWLALLPLTLAALLVQVTSEELFFRGYLQSQLAARLPHPAVWLVLPSLFFAAGHWAPGIYGGNAWLVALWAFLFGLAAADLTARAGTLAPAIALHLVNNAAAIAITAPQGDLSGLALYLLPFGAGDEAAVRAWLPVDLVTMGLGWLAARLALRV